MCEPKTKNRPQGAHSDFSDAVKRRRNGAKGISEEIPFQNMKTPQAKVEAP